MTRPHHVPGDSLRCARSGWRGWRCKSLRSPGRTLCPRHLRLASAYEQRKRIKKFPPPASPGLHHLSLPSPPEHGTVAPRPLPNGRVVVLGQIWALPHDWDRLPRAYARIEKIHPTVSMVSVAPLEFYPVSPDELRWAEAGLPISCGTFRASTPSVLKPISSLSHLALNTVEEPPFKPQALYKLFPRKNEVWAIYRDCDGMKISPLYKLVEVTSDFTEENGVTVVALAGDSRGLLRRQFCEGFELVRRFSKGELPLFSHQVPAFKLAGEGWDGPGGVLWRVGRALGKYEGTF